MGARRCPALARHLRSGLSTAVSPALALMLPTPFPLPIGQILPSYPASHALPHLDHQLLSDLLPASLTSNPAAGPSDNHL